MENVNDLILALKSNKISAVAMDSAVADSYVSHNPGIMKISAGLHSADSNNNVAFPKGATSLVKKANQTIKQVTTNNLYVDKFIPDSIKHMSSNKKNFYS